MENAYPYFFLLLFLGGVLSCLFVVTVWVEKNEFDLKFEIGINLIPITNDSSMERDL